MMPRRVILLVLALAMAGCVAGTTTGTSPSANEITAEDLVPYEGWTLGEVLRRLRPEWLRPRASSGPVRVSVTGQALGTPALRVDGTLRADLLGELDQLYVEHLALIRYLSSTDATMLYGTGFPHGLIEVTTRG